MAEDHWRLMTAIPSITLNDGRQIPQLGFGTFRVAPDDTAEVVRMALEAGYRHIDTAEMYENEGGVGEGVRASGLDREDVFVTSKLSNAYHRPDDARRAFDETLSVLGFDYVDLFLIHWPFPNHHDPGVDVNARHPHSKPYIHADFMKVWRQMERIADAGLAHHIGTSNMTVPKIRLLMSDCRIKPAFNEMELHPHFQQPELFDYCRSHGIIPVGYSPLGSPNRPPRDTTPTDTVDIQDPVILTIAEAHGIHPATVCLKWAVQRGQVPIPMSTKRRNILSNLKAVTEDPLTGEEMEAISRIDRNCRLIKGQVFLWPGSKGWEELWDEDGTVAGPNPRR
ncbi:MAG: aldo/keto reductase [Spirochaetales bacterium]|nr:MAG: aldo/keto reductase [Spirochaetales bacterium]